MSHPTLRLKDGFPQGRSALRDDVKRLQRALAQAGYPLVQDGLFGSDTRDAVRAFQRREGLDVDGVVGPKTWSALAVAPVSEERPATGAIVEGFETFHGDLAWVHDREGHAGRPYWPGGQSGVTLDPGFDLGYQSLERARELYLPVLSGQGVRALEEVIGLRGNAARNALRRSEALGGVRISKAFALRVMPNVAVPYWQGITNRFDPLNDQETPSSVQTALLSLAYNRGPRNPHLDVLREPISNGRWLALANVIGSMQQDHALRGIRIRRRLEADLIREELAA